MPPDPPPNPAPADLLERIARLEAQVQALSQRVPEEQACLLVISGEMERVHTALMLAHAAVALGLDTRVFFALWGVQALRANAKHDGKGFMGTALSKLLAQDISQLPCGRLNMCGLGPWLMAQRMSKHSVLNGRELMDLAKESGIQLMVCPISLDLLGLRMDELRPDLEVGGATAFLENASRARFTAVF